MKLVFPFFAGAAMSQFLPAQQYNAQPQAAAPAPMGGMDPMMMMLLMGDSKSSSMKDLLPLMMMSGGMGGGAGGMDPMMMMLLMGDDSGSSSTKDLLPLMMMGGMGGQGAQGGMNPLLMMTLMEDSCELKAATKALTGTDDEKKDLARGLKCLDSSSKIVACGDLGDGAHIDYDFIKCESGSGGMSDLLPLMMMGGGMGGDASGMGSMLPLMLMGDSTSGMSDLLPLMMMGGGMGGNAGGMDPMMMMLMMDGDDTSTKAGCDSKFKISHIFTNDKAKVTDAAAIQSAVAGDAVLGAVKTTWETDYADCLTKATSDGSSSSSSSMKDLLPLMMMGGMGGNGAQAGGMDPMMMMMLMD